ncbi:hypothetical protein F5B22DRAFT_643594 [Xylaria bambusicola]|uniref:uncharacterized protein n=1 Tax=Xylaria bambusicola TaxID=326684 RepID=UPI002008DEC0|nr:uncharacterized protein F5B22DRAFT_643594 [Xylaria bambusicola]KAI0522013.1 hypothetical protein F5B22DRAFT_643594 [Xylaria bambusicola]
MVSLIKSRPGGERGLFALRSSSSRTTSSSGSRQASGSGSGQKPRGQDGRTKEEATVVKPWANQPWPLIETLSVMQNITHPALHIANEITLIHNAMIRGLNSIFLQHHHVRQTQDIADLLFLTQSWSTWLLDHHQLKENIMLPGFEAALGVPAGTLTMSTTPSPSVVSMRSDVATSVKGKDKVSYGEEEEDTISFLLHRIYAYASATHKDPQVYNATTLENLLVALGQVLVPHLTRQVGLLASMREMCLSPSIKKKEDDIPGPLPLPVAKIPKTMNMPLPLASNVMPLSPPSTSPPTSPSSSTFSTASAPTSTSSSSSPASSPPTASLSLFPSAAISRPPPPSALHHRKTSSNLTTGSTHKKTNSNGNENDDDIKHASNDHPGAKSLDTIDREAKNRLARARALLAADDRANKLTKVYAAADAQAATTIDHYVIPPMIVRLRDSTITTSYSAGHSRTGSRSMGLGIGTGPGTGGGVGGGNKGDWPRLSVPAVHAIADKLSPRHEGAWRFLPCDVWGRPRELPFLED